MVNVTYSDGICKDGIAKIWKNSSSVYDKNGWDTAEKSGKTIQNKGESVDIRRKYDEIDSRFSSSSAGCEGQNLRKREQQNDRMRQDVGECGAPPQKKLRWEGTFLRGRRLSLQDPIQTKG